MREIRMSGLTRGRVLPSLLYSKKIQSIVRSKKLGAQILTAKKTKETTNVPHCHCSPKKEHRHGVTEL